MRKIQCHIDKTVIWLNTPASVLTIWSISINPGQICVTGCSYYVLTNFTRLYAHLKSLRQRLHFRLSQPQNSQARPTVLPYHHFAVSLKLSLFCFLCREKSWVVSFFFFKHPVMTVESRGSIITWKQRNPSSGSSSFFPFVRAYFASFLELSVINA